MTTILTDQAWTTLLDAVRAGAAQSGENAAAWWEQDCIGGRVSAVHGVETAQLTLAGIADLDPLVMDTLPYLDLSGQWADSPTEQDLYADWAPFDAPDWAELTPEEQAELLDAAREAHDGALVDAIERACQTLIDNQTECES